MSLWILVDAAMPRDAKVLAFADQLHVSLPTAVGHLVMLWGVMGEHTPSGDVHEVGVRPLEAWAGWHGKRGAFYTAFVENFVTDGIVRGWESHQGALIEHAERERARNARRAERRNRGSTAVVPRIRNVTVRNVTEDQDQKLFPAPVVAGPEPPVSPEPVAPVPPLAVVPSEAVPDTPQLSRPRTRRKAAPAAGDTERTSWLTPAKAAWEAVKGPGSFPIGEAARVLSPLYRAGLTADTIGQRLKNYLALRAKLRQFVSLRDFATSHGEYEIPWQEREIVVDGVFTEFGERLSRPPGMSEAEARAAYGHLWSA